MTSHQPNLSARDAAVRIVQRLQEAGHVAYLAGGCVRDRLLGKEPKDYDVATDAQPDRVRELFPRSQAVGESFGVMLIHKSGHAIEVATFREEGGYEDGRRPSHVTFTDAANDASRRDFTINGLFEDPLADGGRGEIIDYVGGQADIDRQVVRAIGDATQRFAEDYLRMLRAVRFSAALGFHIDDDTASAIRLHARYLGQISRERIGQEVQRMLEGDRPTLAAQWLQSLRLDGPTLNESLFEGPTPTLEALGPQPVYATALAAWMIDRHCPLHDTSSRRLEVADVLAQLEHLVHHANTRLLKQWRKALCLSNVERDALSGTLQNLVKALRWPDMRKAHRKRLMARVEWPLVKQLLDAMSYHPAVAQAWSAMQPTLAEYEAEGVGVEPLVTGEDLIAQGHKPGPAFRQMLEDAYDMQLELAFEDREAALTWLRESFSEGSG